MRMSVALATYNGERFLDKQLLSIARQSYKPSEIVISDGGSTDNTLPILENFKHHSPIPTTILRAASPAGINENFTNAFLACAGDYIVVSDQDDLWPTGKLAAFAEKIDRQTMIAYGPSEIITETGIRTGQTTREYIGFANYLHGHIPLYFLHCNCISGHAMLFSRQLLARALPFPDNCLYDHWLALCGAALSDVVFVETGVTLHRIHKDNSTNQHDLKKQAKKEGPKRSKSGRYRSQKADILSRIAKAKELGQTLSVVERRVLDTLESCLLLGGNRFFDVELFTLLYSHSEELFGAKAIHECYKRAFGERWFSLLDRLLGRPRA